jgi:glycosyltransferase involved in cell wall biosynthesis
MAEQPEHPASAVSVALCIAPEAVDRFGNVLRHLVVGLVDQAISLRLLSSDRRVESLRLGPVQTLVHQPISWPMRRRRLTQLLDVLGHHPPDIVHAMSHESYAAAGELAEELEADLVLEVSSQADCAMIRELDRTNIEAYVCVTEGFRQTLVEQMKVSEARVSVIYPGIAASQQATCFAHAERAATILCTTDFERHGGVDLLIDALALLRRRGHTPLAFFLGRGRYEGALRKMVRERGLSPSVTFANPSCDVSSVMRSADIFVRPSVETGFVADVLQAMAAGALVITLASDVLDYLRDGETTMIARNQTADALADSLARAVTEKDEARRIAAGAMEHVRTHHGISVMAEKTASVYRQLVLQGSTFAINRT